MRSSPDGRATRAMRRIKDLVKSALRRTPYRLVRARDPNRFQAIEESLRALAARGYDPKVIVDGGANVGDFARLARRVFGETPEIHLVEPQPACRPALEAMAARPGFHLHLAALGAAAGGALLLSVEPDGVSTGAYVSLAEKSTTIPAPATTIDAILEGEATAADRTLLKLDLEGWELEALKGARRALPLIEVVLIEASFFAQRYEPSILTLMTFLDRVGFDLHDIASLSARGRDNRAKQADLVFVARRSALAQDTAWE